MELILNDMLNLLWITLVIVFIVDLSGFTDSFQPLVWRFLYKGLPYKDTVIKPFFCSLCLVFWFGLAYILITGFSWWLLCYVCLLSYFTPVIKDILLIIKELLIKWLNYL